MHSVKRRAFVGLAAAAIPVARTAHGQAGPSTQPDVPVRKPKAVAKLFKSPEGHPNGLENTREGLWIAEEVSERAYLVDWTGKVLHKVDTESHNTSGIAVGGGFLWMSANGRGVGRDPRPTDRPERRFAASFRRGPEACMARHGTIRPKPCGWSRSELTPWWKSIQRTTFEFNTSFPHDQPDPTAWTLKATRSGAYSPTLSRSTSWRRPRGNRWKSFSLLKRTRTLTACVCTRARSIIPTRASFRPVSSVTVRPPATYAGSISSGNGDQRTGFPAM
jgi:hypothetical protein